MNRIIVTGVATLAFATASAVSAQTPAPSARLTDEQKEHGIETFRLIASAMQSQNVPNDVKSALMGCVYENPVGKISDTVDNAIAANPGKIDRSKPEQMLGVIAQICGYEPPAQGAAPAPGNAPTAAKPPAARSGSARGR
jgi:hypothetical protein